MARETRRCNCIPWTARYRRALGVNLAPQAAKSRKVISSGYTFTGSSTGNVGYLEESGFRDAHTRWLLHMVLPIGDMEIGQGGRGHEKVYYL
jgi:hypothetical protein